MIKLWHDDVRIPPDPSWTWAKTNAEAKVFLRTGEVTECSLDHDLGAIPTGETDPREVMYLKGESADGSGLDLVDWMINNARVPDKVTIHSWNAPGAARMASTLFRAGYYCVVRPFQMTPGYAAIWKATECASVQ